MFTAWTSARPQRTKGKQYAGPPITNTGRSTFAQAPELALAVGAVPSDRTNAGRLDFPCSKSGYKGEAKLTRADSAANCTSTIDQYRSASLGRSSNRSKTNLCSLMDTSSRLHKWKRGRGDGTEATGALRGR